MSFTKITTCLWFDTQALDAAEYYTSIFPNSSISSVQHYTSAGQEHHRKEPGSVMIVSFTLNNHPFVALNGGPQFFHSNATSFMIECEDQAEVDHYWEKLREGGDEKRQACGWLADKWGVAWQVVPKALPELMKGEDKEGVRRVTLAMMGMTKMDIEGLKKAYAGEA